MDPELRNYLDEMKADLRGEMAALKADVAGIRTEMAEMEIRSQAHTEMIETRLLTAFWKWARTAEMKSRQQGVNIIAADERLTILEERVTDLEQRQ